MRFTEEHQWLDATGAEVTIGITEHASTELGDVVYVELPATGARVDKGDRLVVIESVKATADVEAPFAGEVIEVNRAAVDSPELLNDDPIGSVWLVKILADDPKALEAFMDEASYRAFIA